MNIQSISPSIYNNTINNNSKSNPLVSESSSSDIFINNINSAITTSFYKAGIDPNSLNGGEVNMAETAKKDSFNKLMNTLFQTDSPEKDKNNILGVNNEPTLDGSSNEEDSNSEILSIGKINYNAILAKIETMKSQINSDSNLETNKFIENFQQIAGTADPKVINSFLNNLSEEFSTSAFNPLGNNINYTA